MDWIVPTKTPLMMYPIIMGNTADWHGAQAVKAYRRKDYEAYVRHIKIADRLWRRASEITL